MRANRARRTSGSCAGPRVFFYSNFSPDALTTRAQRACSVAGHRAGTSRTATLSLWTIITLTAWMDQVAGTPPVNHRRIIMEPSEPNRQATEGPNAQLEKRPYTTPTLTVHGTVEALTQKITAGSSDGIMGSTLI